MALKKKKKERKKERKKKKNFADVIKFLEMVEVPVVAHWEGIRLVSMRMQVWSLGLPSRSGTLHCCGCGVGQ